MSLYQWISLEDCLRAVTYILNCHDLKHYLIVTKPPPLLAFLQVDKENLIQGPLKSNIEYEDVVGCLQRFWTLWDLQQCL